MAYKANESEYLLLCQNDTNTMGNTQWFFFRVTNTKLNHQVKFHIINFLKSDSLYNYGMKVSVYSKRSFEEKRTGWFRGGEDILYYSNNIQSD